MRMSRGEMSAARTTIPFSPFRSDLTTSLTPRLRCRDFEAKPRREKRTESASCVNSRRNAALVHGHSGGSTEQVAPPSRTRASRARKNEVG